MGIQQKIHFNLRSQPEDIHAKVIYKYSKAIEILFQRKGRNQTDNSPMIVFDDWNSECVGIELIIDTYSRITDPYDDI